MKRLLFFDTETTGLPYNYDAPAFDSVNWPRLVQFGFILCDTNRDVLESGSFLVKPDGFIIPDEAIALHGITTEKATNEGISVEQALYIIERLLSKTDVLVGHNVDFDINVVDAEFFRHNKTTPLRQRTNICTMKASVDWCDLPNHKYPKLIELHKKLFNERIEMVHDAITDTKATFRCFWKLYDLGMISLTIDGLQNKHNCKGDQTDKNLDFSVNREFSSNIQGDFTIEGVTLDPNNKEFKYALESVQFTNQLIYLTGKAGTGKTTFLKYLRKVVSKKMVVLAPTGVAAINAKGQTIHSFFHIPISLFVPDDPRLNHDFYETFHYKKDKIQIIRNLELLVIDEISMVRCDLLDVVDTILKTVRNQRDLPFGGVQILLIGDTFQLPPVVNQNDWSVLQQFYDSEFFFSAKVMSRVKPLYIELKTVYRQKEKEFIDLLNRIRVGKQEPSDIQLLNSRVMTGSNFVEEKNQIILTPTNNVARNENSRKLQALPSKSTCFDAQISGDFPVSNYPTDAKLELKVDAQVMFIKNNWEKGYYNGKIGKVVELNRESITIEITDEHNDTTRIVVEPCIWENIVYSWNSQDKKIEEKVTGTFMQYPLKLAWAITVHKSQGMTFEKVIADISYSFAAGQVYVALSRCTSMNGLTLKSSISPQAIITDPRVIAFAQNEVPETLILEKLQAGKADHYYAESRKYLRTGDAENCYDNFLKAIRYRNDIETNLSKRYFCTWLHWFISGMKMLRSKNETLLAENNKQRKEILNLQEKISQLDRIVIEKRLSIRELKKDAAKNQTELSQLKETISSGEREICELKKDQAKKQKTIGDLKKKNQTITLEKEELLQEIERVRNIKWYQKLFGKK